MSVGESASDDNAADLSEAMTMAAASTAAQPDPSEPEPAIAAGSIEETKSELSGAEADKELPSDDNAQDTCSEDTPENSPETTAEVSTPDPESATPAVADSLPTPEPAPEPAVAATAPAALDPAIAERISIPAGTTTDDNAGTGGEWDLLTAKVTAWWDANNVGEQINNLRQPLRLVGILLGVLLVLKVYSGFLAAIGSIPLAPRLLELVGVCWVARFSATRMVRSKDRSEVIQGLRQRWNSFAGKN